MTNTPFAHDTTTPRSHFPQAVFVPNGVVMALLATAALALIGSALGQN